MADVSYKTLGQAIERLRAALVLQQAAHEDELGVALRDSVLLSFQFTYGLCRPMLERFFVSDGYDPQEVEEMSLAAIIRTANERGVLRADWAQWSEFRDARNRMAHVYSQSVADMILAQVPEFLTEASWLYEQLEARTER